MPEVLNSGQGQSRKVVIGDDFPINDVRTGLSLYGEEFTRCIISFCLLFAFLGIGIGGGSVQFMGWRLQRVSSSMGNGAYVCWDTDRLLLWPSRSWRPG